MRKPKTKCRLSPIIIKLLPHGLDVTARASWTFLKTAYNKIDVAAQFMLRNHVSSLSLHDITDVDHYLGKFNIAHQQFITMDVNYSKQDAVHQVISGLPSSGSWDHFKQLLLELIKTIMERAAENAALGRPIVPDEIYMKITNCITSECMHLCSSKNTYGPGSEYAQVVSEIKRHSNNPNGIECTDPKCPEYSRRSHDFNHCWSPGGGAENQHLDRN
jgi:hypothetical protein